MKKLVILLCISIMCNHHTLRSQEIPDSCCVKDHYYSGLISLNVDNSVYTAMQNMWYANEKISYICVLPVFRNLKEPKIPLLPGEGKNGKYLMDANIYQQLPILMGRNHGNHNWQTSRITLDYCLSLRMSRDASNPVLPYNDIIGLTVDKVLWDSHTKKGPRSREYKFAFEDWNNLSKSLQNVSMNLTAHHYSNGQQPGFFLYDTINGVPLKRNDYRKGDFSTNYIQIGLTYSNLRKSRNLYSVKVAYQHDGSLVGPLYYSDEQEKSYGHDRILGFFQARFTLRKNDSTSAKVQSLCDNCKRTKRLGLYKSYEFVVRLDYEYILGNLSEYPYANKYRLNSHLYVQFTRPNWRALGIVFHQYYGRDYSNIRYDLPVSATMIGLSVNFNKYRPPFSDKQKFYQLETADPKYHFSLFN